MTKLSHNKPEAPPPPAPAPREVDEFNKQPDQQPKKTFTERPGFFRGAKVRKP